MAPSSRESGIDDFFMPLRIHSTHALPRRTKPRAATCPVRSPRKRSIKFADEDRQLLETVLLFEPDESFTEASLYEAMMDDSHSSFDSYEYANGGNCPSPSSVHILASSQDINVPPVNIVALNNTEGPSAEELEQQVREQQARELAAMEPELELEESHNKRRSAPAKLLASMAEPTTPVEVAQQKLKAEELRNARDEEKEQLLEQARKEREVAAEEAKKKQQKEVRRVVSEPPKGTISTIAQKRASFEQAARQQQQQQQQQNELKAKQEMELRKIREAKEAAKKVQQKEDKPKSQPGKGTQGVVSGKENYHSNKLPAWKQRDAELLQKAREEAALRQQRAQEEAESLKGAAHREKLTAEELTAARNAKSAQQKRLNELQDVGLFGKVGTNMYTKRERGVVRVQAAARRFLVLRAVRRQKRLAACVLVQRQVRGFLVRRDMAELQGKIANLEEHLKNMEEAKQEEIKSIQNDPEIAALIDQLDDAHATAIRKQKELKQERLDLRNNIDSIKEHNENIGQAMENLRINNRKIAKHTRYLEEQVPRLNQRIRTLEKTQAQFQQKADQWAGKVKAMQRECVQANQKLESEARVADLAHDTILRIREHVKESAKTSSDPFLAKVKKRSAILERLNNNNGGGNGGDNGGRDSMQSCPVILSR